MTGEICGAIRSWETKMDETTAAAFRKMILEALEHHKQTGPIGITEVWYGPRHNELGFKTSSGTNVVISIRDFV